MSAAGSGTLPDPSTATTVRTLAARAFDRVGPDPVATGIEQLPLGRPGARALIRMNVQPGSRSLLVVTRVGVATITSGALAGLLGLDHAYWAMTAAVLVLHQGLDRLLHAGAARGLLLATAVIATHPYALWLVAVIMVLNFFVELTVVRNYTLAVVFITAMALVISTGARGSDNLGALLLARGVDTAVGCAVALAVFLLLVPASVTEWLPTALADTLDAVGTTTGYLAAGAMTTPAAKAARRDLQRCVLRLAQLFDNAINGSTQQRRAAEHTWPAIAATQRLAYRTVAECWQFEQVPPSLTAESAGLASHFTDVQSAVRATAEAVRAGRTPLAATLGSGPLSDEVLDVREALEREPN